MLKELLKNKKLKPEIDKFFKENRQFILDIILFGSKVKGKEKPNDIDILILYKDKKNFDISYELKKILKNYNVDITDKSYNELFNDSFKIKENILSEGYSLINNKSLSEALNYKSFALFKYELKGFTKSNRVRFHYSLYGRNKKDNGILKDLSILKFSDTVLLCPIENTEKAKEFFEYWKIRYIEFPIMIPARIAEFIKKS